MKIEYQTFDFDTFQKMISETGSNVIVANQFIHRNSDYHIIKKCFDDMGIKVVYPVEFSVDSIEKDLIEYPVSNVLCFGSGMIIDLVKSVCQRNNFNLDIVLLNLSNDGFASPWSSLPNKDGNFDSIASICPRHIYFIYDLIIKSPLRFVYSGLGECIAKFNVIEDLICEYPETLIEGIYQKMLFYLEELSHEFNNNNYQENYFQLKLFYTLHEASKIMCLELSQGSSLGSRSEHEFEKACLLSGLNITHGILVLIGALVTGKVRAIFLQRKNSYSQMIYYINRFNMENYVVICLLYLYANKDSLFPSLKKLNLIRPNRLSLWNNIDTNLIEWEIIFHEVLNDLDKNKS